MIWHLIDSSGFGGAERHIGSFVGALVRYGVPAQAVLYQDHGPNRWLDQLAAEGVPHKVLSGSPRGLYNALRRERPALVHTHGYKAGVIGRLAARAAGVPVVSTFHSGERSGWPVGAYERLDEWTSALGGRIAVSKAIQARLPYRADLVSSFVPLGNRPVGALPRRVGFVGRLSAEKGPELFCRLAVETDVSAEWHVWGDGPLLPDLRARYGGSVRFHGAVNDLADVWTSLGLLVMPSRFEGVPLAALEALAAGVPVLASRVGGLPGLVEEGVTGWLFEPGDIAGARKGLQAWATLDDAAADRMRGAAWDVVRHGYSEAVQLPRLIDVYRQLGVLELPETTSNPSNHPALPQAARANVVREGGG